MTPEKASLPPHCRPTTSSDAGTVWRRRRSSSARRFSAAAHDGGDDLAEAALVLQADHVALAQDGKIAGGIAGEQARGLQLLAAQADHQRLSREVGMQPDVLQGADGNGGARRVDGDAAAVGVGDGDHAVHVGEARQKLGADALRGVLHGGRDALHGGGDAEDVLRAGAAVGVAVALEGVAIERRQRRAARRWPAESASSGGAAGMSSSSSRTQLPAGMARLAMPMVWP